MKRFGKLAGIVALVAAIGFSMTACGGSGSPAEGDPSSSAGGGGDGWSSWHSVTLAGDTNAVQFSLRLVGPEPPQGSVVEIQMEGLTPASLTLTAAVPHGSAAAPQAGATFRFRYRQGGGRGHSGTNPIHFLW